MATALLENVITSAESASPARPRDTWINGLLWATVLLGIAWRLGRYLMQFPLWGDEAHIAVNFLDRDFWGMTRKLDYGQVAPVLFLWVEWLAYQLMGPSELALRLVPVLAGIAALALFRRFCQRTMPPLPCAFAVALLAVSYYPVRHAAEVKPYSFDLLMTIALLLPAVRWVQEPGRLRWLICLTLLTPITVAGSYPAVFVAGSVSVYLLPTVWRQSWQARGWYVAFNLAMVGAFLAHMLLVGREQLDPQGGTVDTFLHQYWQDWFPPANLLDLPLWLLKAHTGNMLAYPAGGPHFGSSATFLLCLVGLWAMWRAGRRDLSVLCLAPVALSLVAAFVNKYPYGGSARLAQHLAPAICILMGFGIAQLLLFVRSTWRQHAAITVLFALIVFGVAGLVMSLAKPYKMLGDVRIREMAQDLAAKVEPNDTLVVYNPHDSLRPNMVWYLRLVDRPLVFDAHPDWPTIGHQGRFWGIHVRTTANIKRNLPATLPTSQSTWTEREHLEYTFPADSKDVPLQYCEVYRWVRQRVND